MGDDKVFTEGKLRIAGRRHQVLVKMLPSGTNMKRRPLGNRGDRRVWSEESNRYCEDIYADPEEADEVQKEGDELQEVWYRSNQRSASCLNLTVHLVMQAQSGVSKDKANGREDIMVM